MGLQYGHLMNQYLLWVHYILMPNAYTYIAPISQVIFTRSNYRLKLTARLFLAERPQLSRSVEAVEKVLKA